MAALLTRFDVYGPHGWRSGRDSTV
jgi:hypothetical protein